MSQGFSVTLPSELLDEIARLAAELIRERPPDPEAQSASPYMSVAEAAEYMRASRQRVYDLLSARRLTRYKEGRRTLLLRAEIAGYVAQNDPSSVAPALPHAPQRGSGTRPRA